MKTLTISVCIIFTLIITIYGQDDDLRIYPTTDFHQTENSITIDPTDPNNLISAFISSSLTGETRTPYFFSHDAGVTWEGTNNSPNGVSTIGDPFVVFNIWGEAFFINKGNPGINFFKSIDKGETWITKPKPTTSSYADKPHLLPGMFESNKNNIYAVWTHAQPGNFRIYFCKSTNRGDSWGSLKTVYSDIEKEGLGAYVIAGPEGNIYVAFVKLAKDTGVQTDLLIYRSTDGGDNFSQIYLIDLLGMGSPRFPNTYFNQIPINSFPFLTIDNDGNVYLVYTNNTDESGGDIHVYFRKSVNQGLNWTSAQEIHTGQPGIRQWFPSIAIDKTDSKIYV